MPEPQVLHPDGKLTYSFDWSDWLADGASISSRQWSVEPQTSDSPPSPRLTDATSAVVTIDNGEHGKEYRLSEDVVASDGTSDVRTVTIVCSNNR